MSESEKILTRIYQPGEIIIREGDPGSHVYLIISGSVEIYKTVDNNRQSLNVLGSGEIFGEMGLVTNEPRYATVVAAEETRLIMVNDKTFHSALLSDKLPIIKPLTKQLVLRLKDAEEQLQKHQREIKVLQDELALARGRLKKLDQE